MLSICEQQGWFSVAVNRPMFYRLWHPPGKIAAVVQIMHGMAEHSGRYGEFAAFMASHGYLVAANDHPGHGETGAQAGGLGLFARRDGWHRACQALQAFNTWLQRSYGLPIIVLGHSMGSFFARCLLTRQPQLAQRWILSGSGDYPLSKRLAGRLVTSASLLLAQPDQSSRLLQRLIFRPFKRRFRTEEQRFAWLCSDPAVCAAYAADPYCGWIGSTSLYRDLFVGIGEAHRWRTLKQQVATRPAPEVLVIGGAEDPVGEFGQGLQRLTRHLHWAGVTTRLQCYPDMRHEVLHEIDKSRVWQDVLAFCEDSAKR